MYTSMKIKISIKSIKKLYSFIYDTTIKYQVSIV